MLRDPSLLVFLTVASVLLSGCPGLLDDEFQAVDGSGGRSGAGGASGLVDAGGVLDAGFPPVAGGAAGQIGSSGAGGTGTAGDAAGTGGAGADAAGGTAAGSAGSAGVTGWTAGTSGGGGRSGGSGGSGGGGGGTGGTVGGSGGMAGGTGGGTSGSGGMAGAAGGADSGAGGVYGGAGGTGGFLCASSPIDCQTLRDSLIHRYRFEGTGTAVIDSVGNADGVVMGGAELSGQGELELAGVDSGEYVDLPNELISTLEDATIEAWLVWNGGEPYQRVFDFGDALRYSCSPDGQAAPEGEPGACGRTYLNLMLSTDSSQGGTLCAAFLRQPGVHPDDRVVLTGPLAPTNVELHVALAVDDSGDQWRLYFEGALEAADTFVDHLSDVHDINNWLGQSQFAHLAGQSFAGTYLEFRVYDTALSGSEIETSFSEGPDAAFLD